MRGFLAVLIGVATMWLLRLGRSFAVFIGQITEQLEAESHRGDTNGSVSTAAILRRVGADVAGRVALDDREAVSIDRFLLEIDRLEDPLDQRLDPVHVTGSAIVVGPRGVLLLKHKRLGLWLQPGGHIDPGEAPWQAALREAIEETGLDLAFAGPVDAEGIPELIHVDVHPGGRGHTHLDTRYLIEAGDDDPAPPPGESQQIGWFDWDTAIEMADPGLCALLGHLRDQG